MESALSWKVKVHHKVTKDTKTVVRGAIIACRQIVFVIFVTLW